MHNLIFVSKKDIIAGFFRKDKIVIFFRRGLFVEAAKEEAESRKRQ